MNTVYFDEVKISGKKRGKCACGKYRVRSASFTQTLNPFNKTTGGSPKQRPQIFQELQDEREEWKKEQIFCDVCTPLSYYKWTEEQRNEYNEKGQTFVLTGIGLTHLMINKNFRPK